MAATIGVIGELTPQGEGFNVVRASNVGCTKGGRNVTLQSIIDNGSVTNIWSGTQAEYDALVQKISSTLYCITG